MFRIIIGEEKPDFGALRLGDTVKVAYVDQSRASLDAERSVWEVISGEQEQISIGRHVVGS